MAQWIDDGLKLSNYIYYEVEVGENIHQMDNSNFEKPNDIDYCDIYLNTPSHLWRWNAFIKIERNYEYEATMRRQIPFNQRK